MSEVSELARLLLFTRCSSARVIASLKWVGNFIKSNISNLLGFCDRRMCCVKFERTLKTVLMCFEPKLKIDLITEIWICSSYLELCHTLLWALIEYWSYWNLIWMWLLFGAFIDRWAKIEDLSYTWNLIWLRELDLGGH